MKDTLLTILLMFIIGVTFISIMAALDIKFGVPPLVPGLL